MFRKGLWLRLNPLGSGAEHKVTDSGLAGPGRCSRNDNDAIMNHKPCYTLAFGRPELNTVFPQQIASRYGLEQSHVM